MVIHNKVPHNYLNLLTFIGWLRNKNEVSCHWTSEKVVSVRGEVRFLWPCKYAFKDCSVEGTIRTWELYFARLPGCQNY